MLREMDSIENDWAALFWALESVKSMALSRKEKDVMRGERINRISGRAAIVLSLIALCTVLGGYLQPPGAPQDPDEGTGAHIFQLSVAALLPIILLFLGTADWKKPFRSARPLALPAAALVLAFGALYYLEHYYLQH